MAYDYIVQHGVVQEWDFGYQSFDGSNVSCSLETHAKPRLRQSHQGGAINATTATSRRHLMSKDKTYFQNAVASLIGWTKLESNSYRSLMNAVAKLGPIPVSVSTYKWHAYQGGVFSTPLNTRYATDINHLVVVEGYGTDEETGEDYWLVRNSFGYVNLAKRKKENP